MVIKKITKKFKLTFRIFFEDKFLFFFICLSLIIRLTFSFLPGFKYDVGTWFAWAIRLSDFNFSLFYSDAIWTNYTPGYLYILAILGFLKNNFHIADSLFYYALKIPAELVDIFLGLIIYKFAYQKLKSVKIARIAALFILLNPAFIFNSSIWGQIDSILTLFLFLSFIYLESNQIISSFFFAIAFLIKPQAIMLIPVFIFFTVRNFSLKKSLKILITFSLTISLLSFPFFIQNPITGTVNLFIKMTSDYSYTSLYAYNLWGVFGFWIPDNQQWLSFSLKNWGLLLFSFYWLIIFFVCLKKRLSLITILTLASLSFYFLPTRVHERYLYPGLFFLITSGIIYKNRALLLFSIILSSIHFFNLYYVYVYYNEVYFGGQKLLYLKPIYTLIGNYAKILSLISFSIFMLISYILIKLNVKKN